MFDINEYDYHYTIKYSEEDKEFVATCKEFPSLSYLDINSEMALKGLKNMINDIIKDMFANNEEVPKPI